MQFKSTVSEKNHYSFKELSSLTGIKPYVLRFWESEFDQINPEMSEGGEKLYSFLDKSNIETIKELLFEQKLSIPEAKGHLDSLIVHAETKEAQIVEEVIQEVVADSTEPVALDERVFAHQSSLEMMRNSLGRDLEQAKQIVPSKPSLSVDYTEKDMLQLLHAKKKLNAILKRAESVSAKYHW